MRYIFNLLLLLIVRHIEIEERAFHEFRVNKRIGLSWSFQSLPKNGKIFADMWKGFVFIPSANPNCFSVPLVIRFNVRNPVNGHLVLCDRWYSILARNCQSLSSLSGSVWNPRNPFAIRIRAFLQISTVLATAGAASCEILPRSFHSSFIHSIEPCLWPWEEKKSLEESNVGRETRARNVFFWRFSLRVASAARTSRLTRKLLRKCKGEWRAGELHK